MKNNIHVLKSDPVPFRSIKTGVKTFEVRKNDRNFKVDDILIFQEYEPDNYWNIGEIGKGYTGDSCERRISFILENGYGVKKDFVVMSIVPI